MRRALIVALANALLVIAAAMVTAPPPLQSHTEVVPIPQDLETYLANQEALAAGQFGLIPETEKRIRWFDGIRDSQTLFSIVYLHGFSATRQEIAPVSEMIADRIGANLFETRLVGRGRENLALELVHAEDWLRDAAEALAIGARLGQKVIVIGTSTGATLALAMTQHPTSAAVDAIVMISPNFAPVDRSAELLTFPGGPQLARIIVGTNYSWQAKYRTTDYPMGTVVEMMRLVQFTRAQLPMTLDQRVLTIMSPTDTVVSPEKTRSALARIAAAEQLLIEYAASSDEGQHVLAGDILSPESNEAIASHIIEFVSRGDS